MRSRLAKAIRDARRASRLTQEQLGRRLGLKGRAISRWEWDKAAPSRRHRKALVTAIAAVNQTAAALLDAEFASASNANQGPERLAVAALPAPQSNAPKATLEHAVFSMADELDLPPRRVRGALSRLLKRLRETDTALDAAQRQLDQWIAETH